MSDLDRLIEAVEAGKCWLPDSDKWKIIGINGNDASSAFYGSLDAAMRLHEALLPGWAWGRWSNGNVWVTDNTDDADRFVTSKGYFQDATARAWLLAILRAVRVQKEEGK